MITDPDIIGVSETPEIVGYCRIVHRPSGEDFTERIRWLNMRTGEALVYRLDESGRKFVDPDDPTKAAMEDMASDWKVWIKGRRVYDADGVRRAIKR